MFQPHTTTSARPSSSKIFTLLVRQIPLSTLNSVSYTHLDVYKRQISSNAPEDAISEARRIAESLDVSQESVSYTHLDVYKRQGPEARS